MSADQNPPRNPPENPDGFADLCEALLLLKNTDECRSFLTDLCSPAEIKALSERWVIARLLDRGDASYRDISAATGASTTTVGRVARFLEKEPYHGYRLILDRLKAIQR
ncbi:MAG: YerC/YecD family TrpR-related protein [Alphaproteobacteria bacterium]|nr:YerC/YecD family TrpR-related protein [Alphaproteobacteria bacterium]